MDFILGGLFIFIIIAFVAGMLFLPELFGISKNLESDTTSVVKRTKNDGALWQSKRSIFFQITISDFSRRRYDESFR